MNLSFKQRIMAAVLVAALVPMAVVGGLATYMGFQNSRDVSEAGMAAVEEATKLRIQDYFGALMEQVKNRASDPYIQTAFKEFVAAEGSFDPGTVAVDMAKLKERYAYQQGKTKGAKEGDADAWMPKDPVMLAMQHLYISGNPNKIGEKQKLDAAQDGSDYSAVHAKYHPGLRAFVEQFGFYDVFLVDAATGRVVYSDSKEIDFMSNVKDGALADTVFSRVVRQAMESHDPNAIFMSDIETYVPSYNDVATFMAAPIIINGKTVGVFVVQLPIVRINSMFEALKKLGDTVDGFLAGEDLTFRTPQTAEEGKVGDKVNAVLGNVLTQVFQTKKGGIRHYVGSDGAAMTGAFEILDFPGVQWVMVVGQDNAEMLASTYNQLYLIGGITLVVVVAVSLFGMLLGTRLSAPVVKMGREFNGNSVKVAHSTGLVGDAVASMIAASEETSAQSTVVRKNSAEAAGYVQTVSGAVEELNTSIHDISRSIMETNELVDDAVSKAQHTDEVVRKLGEASLRITEVVGLINDLAAQTNLLALNAAIEAARAGDAGRGFAVVADEVKKLASHTTQATVDIGAQIKEIQDVSEQSVRALQEVVRAIHLIRDNATAVSAAVEEQSGVAKQISTNVHDAAQRVKEVDDNMTGIEQAANDTGVAADQVKQAVGEVQDTFRDMKGQMEVTLAKMGVKA